MKPFIPHPYQEIAIDHIIQYPYCAMWADLGMGKTSSVIRALQKLSYVKDVFPALITAPLRVAETTWKEELAKWTEFSSLRISTIVGDESERLSALKKDAHFYTINYENLIWLIDLYGKKFPFKTIIIDESTKVKGTRKKQGAKVGGALYKASLLPSVQQIVQLTGLCAPNGLADLYGQILFLDQGERLGQSFDAFQKRWFMKSWENEYDIEPLPHAQREIEEKLKDICLSINAEDWFNLEKPIEIPVHVDLPPEARRIYKDMERDMFAVIEKEGVETFNAAGKRNKAMQIADGLLFSTDGKSWKEVHREKIKALESVIEESAGMPLLTAYHFKPSLDMLKKAFPKGADISKKEGLEKFKSGKLSAGFAHPGSMGHGINGLEKITNRMCYYSHNDNYDNHKQILGRIGPVRQMQSGFNRPVFVYDLIAKNTVEEYAVLPNLRDKGTLNDLLRQAMKRIKR